MTPNRVPLRVEAAQIALVLDRLDSAEASREYPAKRRYIRHCFRTRQPIVMQCQRADGSVSYEVVPRNISARGLSVLFGTFIYPQTACQVAIPTLGGELRQVSGTVRWCRHISRALHEGGIEFGDRIDLAAFLDAAPGAERSEIQRSGEDLHRVIAVHAERLAILARDQRSMAEMKESFEKIRKAIDLDSAAKSPWVQ